MFSVFVMQAYDLKIASGTSLYKICRKLNANPVLNVVFPPDYNSASLRRTRVLPPPLSRKITTDYNLSRKISETKQSKAPTKQDIFWSCVGYHRGPNTILKFIF